jgi:hypothetical protein
MERSARRYVSPIVLKLSNTTGMDVAIRLRGALHFMNVSFMNMKEFRQATPSHQRV